MMTFAMPLKSLALQSKDKLVKTEMVRTRPATRRWPLHQAYSRSGSVWTSESGKAEKEMDKQHLMARSHQPEPHTSGRWGSRWLQKKNPCGCMTPHLRDLQPEGKRDAIACVELDKYAACYTFCVKLMCGINPAGCCFKTMRWKKTASMSRIVPVTAQDVIWRTLSSQMRNRRPVIIHTLRVCMPLNG